jgi:hypothetical protein
VCSGSSEEERKIDVLQQSSPPSNQTLDIIKLILPFITFTLGYVLSSFDKFRETRRKQRNMRSILFKELKENYELLNKVIPADEQRHSHNPQLVALLTQNLSLAVYDKYLGSLSELSPEEVDKIYDAYSHMLGAVKDGKSFLATLATAKDQGQDDEHRSPVWAAAVSVITRSDKALEAMAAALLTFKNGQSTLDALKGERGSALVTYDEVSNMIKETDRMLKETDRPSAQK